MGIAQDLRVAARRWLQVRRRRRDRPGPTALEASASERESLRQWLSGLGAARESAALRDAQVFELDASQLPWMDTGLDLETGEWVTTVAAGRVVLSDPLDVWVGPQFQLWARVGENGRVFNGTADTNSFRCTEAGRLYLANYFPGQWADPAGRLATSMAEYAKFRGGITVVVLRWRGRVEDGLDALQAAGEDARDGGWLTAEQQRLREDVAPPRGWSYLWFLGQSDIFQPDQVDGHDCIRCHTSRNVGILQKDTAMALRPGTRLRWSWKVDELPSMLPEDTAASHDYLSIAVEFENGRDITYTWSRELPEGHGYWCPLPTWKDREYHVVIRSGTDNLGRWLGEDRDLCADYRRYMGEPPSRIVRVWLIAVSIFQRGSGQVLFRDIRLEGPDGTSIEVG